MSVCRWFHSVQQGLGNGVQAVRCTHKQHMGQIIRLFYEMIAESIILLPIQHFKECGGRVAVMRNAQLIHLVQKHQRIYSSCLLHRVNDAPRSEEIFDLERAAKILDKDHYGLKKVKERILEYLAVRELVLVYPLFRFGFNFFFDIQNGTFLPHFRNNRFQLQPSGRISRGSRIRTCWR